MGLTFAKKRRGTYTNHLNQIEIQKYLSCWYCCKPMALAAPLIKHKLIEGEGRAPRKPSVYWKRHRSAVYFTTGEGE